MKHIQTRFLWTQERVAAGDLGIKTIRSQVNEADLLTKILTGPEIAKHMRKINQIYREGRAHTAKKVLK